MRLARLDLLRYGRFTNVSLEFPKKKQDLHILFGPNEAGKTTSLTAIEDLLFGIPERSPYNFLHNYDSMRLGAVLENNGNLFAFQRRKGHRNVILGVDGNPLAGGEGLLAPFISGIDRTNFDRMFNLSHSRLAEGGKLIIEAKDDVGQMLFSASTGLSDFRERLNKLDEEADGLWSPRESQGRLYYQARARMKDAKERQRNNSLSTNAWQSARKDLENAEKDYETRRKEHETLSIELKKLARIRRIFPTVRRKSELESEITELGKVKLLADDAGKTLAEAEKVVAELNAQIEVLTPYLLNEKKDLEQLNFDDALVRQTNDIILLNEQRIEIRRSSNELPKKRDEFNRELNKLADLAAEIGWESIELSMLIERVPQRNKLEQIRSLLTQDRELETLIQSAYTTCEDARVNLEENENLLGRIGQVLDVSGLKAVLKTIQSSDDVTTRIRMEQGRVDEAAEEIKRILKDLSPPLPDNVDAEGLVVPAQSRILAHRDEVRDWRERQRNTINQLNDARNALERDKAAFNQRINDEGAVAPGTVEDARAYRDTLWNLVKERYIQDSEISDEDIQDYAEELKNLPISFQDAVKQADSVADLRLDKARAASELLILNRNIAQTEVLIEQLEADEIALEGEGKLLEETWSALWSSIPIEVATPDEMLEWLNTRNEILKQIVIQRKARHQLDDYRNEENEAIALVQTELARLEWDPNEINTASLRVMVEMAEAFCQEQEARSERLELIQDNIRKAKSNYSRRRDDLKEAENKREVWKTKWSRAVSEIGLKANDLPNVVEIQINVLEQMQVSSTIARNLQDKDIPNIERDIEVFRGEVNKFLKELAPDLVGMDINTAVEELEQRREQALEFHKQYKELTESVIRRQEEIDNIVEDRKKKEAIIQLLKGEAGVTNDDELRIAVERSDRLRLLNQELDNIMETLDQQGDGLAIDVLDEECRNINIDEIRTREEVVDNELNILNERLEQALIVHTKANSTFNAIVGDDAAAKASADQQEALAAMKDAAERYVRVRTSGLLLRWAIDRYRTEKQGPLLKRSSKLFQILTQKSFEKLAVDFDDRDNLQLTGIRPDGNVVPLAGLSSGTEDQLFLALRLAAVEDYIERVTTLPFVADDLFINFDQDRAASGFEVLGHLSERTQVLFFTHHQHLIDVALKKLGPSTNVVSL